MRPSIGSKPVRKPDSEHPGLNMFNHASIADARNDVAKLNAHQPMLFTSELAERAPDSRDPVVNYRIDLHEATPVQLKEASAYAASLVPVLDGPEAHKRRLDARLHRLQELMSADRSARKEASVVASPPPFPYADPFTGAAPQQQPQVGFQSFTPPPPDLRWSQPDRDQVAPQWAPPPPAQSAWAQQAKSAGAPPWQPPRGGDPTWQPTRASELDLRPSVAATFYFPHGKFPAAYHHVNVQRAADGRPVAVYLVHDNRFGVVPFMAEDVEGEFGLSLTGGGEAYTVESTGLVHAFLHYTIGVLTVAQVHSEGRG